MLGPCSRAKRAPFACTQGKEVLEPKATYILYKLVVAEEGAPPTPEMLWVPPEGYVVPAAAAGGKADPKGKKK